MTQKELLEKIEQAAREGATELDFSNNQLTELPPEIVKLTQLTSLYLSSNGLTELPPEIGKLTQLTSLDLDSNQLTELPPEIGKLTQLTWLDLDSNQLTELPPEIGKLTQLTSLYLSGNKLTFPPPDIVEQGADAVLSYLREQLEKAEQQWVSKLLIVGEGGVGKTSLLRALKDQPFQEGLETTHGIQIHDLDLQHPTKSEVMMQLSAWDFGGQEIYHATHQFFLTDRSLFILVWNARHGYEQGKLYYWLDAIQARAPESPVILVATWVDERDPDLPIQELQKAYPQIIGHCAISNKTGEGIDDLHDTLAKAAADLPLMGMTWPGTWLDAAEDIRTLPERYIEPQELWQIMAKHGVGNQQVLARSLHELGDILFFQNENDLNDTIILKPQWLTEHISKVLESDDVIGRDGIFTRDHMDQLWVELPRTLRDHFLRLMEQFDLSYRTLEDREISLVVERLPLDPPENHEEKWNAIKETKPCREIAIKFELNTIPAGIPTWFIARSHRFTTHTHWRNGAVFADEPDDYKHLALAQAFPHDRSIHLSVRGPNPHNFLALLKDGFELILNRFPGLKITRTIPCLGHYGEPCTHEFDYENLQRAIEHDPPITEIQCPVAFENVPVSDLLIGLHWRAQDNVLERLNEMVTNQEAMLSNQKTMLSELSDLRELTQREFLNLYRLEQANVDSQCPNVFTLHPAEGSSWARNLVGQKMQLHLSCQAPGEWHQVKEGGVYDIREPAQWLQTTAPYISKLFGVFKYAAPVVGVWLGTIPQPEAYAKQFQSNIKLMEELIKKLPDLNLRTDRLDEHRDPERIKGAALRAIRRLLDKEDPDQNWGGLNKVITPEGHHLWLCDHHAEEYRL